MKVATELEVLSENIGKKVKKKSINNDDLYQSKPFKSGKKINTVKGIIMHPILFIPAYIFEEDESYVECRRCKVVEENEIV